MRDHESHRSLEHSDAPERVIVSALIMNPKGEWLLLSNIKYGFMICPPGGKQEEGESLEDAVRREVREELGVEMRVINKLCTYPMQSPECRGLAHMFLCEIISGELQNREPEKTGHFDWFTMDDLDALEEHGLLAHNLHHALLQMEMHALEHAEKPVWVQQLARSRMQWLTDSSGARVPHAPGGDIVIAAGNPPHVQQLVL